MKQATEKQKTFLRNLKKDGEFQKVGIDNQTDIDKLDISSASAIISKILEQKQKQANIIIATPSATTILSPVIVSVANIIEPVVIKAVEKNALFDYVKTCYLNKQKLNLSEVKGLIKSGADVNFAEIGKDDERGKQTDVLYYVSLLGDLEIIKELVAENVNVNFCSNPYGYGNDSEYNTALTIACGNYIKDTKIGIETIEFLLCNKANVDFDVKYRCDYEDEDKVKNPLLLAFQAGNVELIELLLKYKADINFSGKIEDDGNFVEYSILTKLCQNYNGNKKLLDILVSQGIDFNAKFSSGTGCDDFLHSSITPLIIACKHENAQLVKDLLLCGADVNILANFNQYTHDDDSDYDYNESPFLIASQGDNIEMIKLLIESGADINAVGKGSKNALMYALENENTEIIKLLTDSGVNINGVSNGNYTALHLLMI